MFMTTIKKQFARQLRRLQTDPEKIMWQLLRNRRFQGIKFRRQHVVEGFIADFCCHTLKFIVEIDGWVHENQKEYDRAREIILLSKGYSIIRFTNDQVVCNLSKVCRDLEFALSLALSPRERVEKSKDIVK